MPPPGNADAARPSQDTRVDLAFAVAVVGHEVVKVLSNLHRHARPSCGVDPVCEINL